MRRTAIVVAVVLLLGFAGFATLRGRAKTETPSGAARKDVMLTVYSQDFALVSEDRPVQLTAGDNRIGVAEVSRQLDPESVLLKWKGAGSGLPELVSHNYDLGVEGGTALLKRYLGKDVEVVRYGDNGRESERQKGRLMVDANDDMVVQSDDKFYVHPSGTIVAPANPDVVTIPQLSVLAVSRNAQAADLEVTYLSRGLSWSADYVATLSRTSDDMALECWASVTNRSGADYPNAKVALIAGSPNRAAVADRLTVLKQQYWQNPSLLGNEMDGHVAKREAGGFGGAGAMPFQAPQALADMHVYRIKNPTSVAQDRMNRLLMISAPRVPIVRDYSARAPQIGPWYDGGWGTPAQPVRGNVAVAITLFNKAEGGLGDPLPSGAIRVYEPDSTGALRYVGAATVRDTPKDQRIDLTLSNSFDVYTEWKLTKTERIGKHKMRKSVELVLHNEKSQSVNLRIVQQFGGQWSVVRESAPHTKLDAYQGQWAVPLPAESTVTLSYTVELGV